jgi:hypothetical protein
VIEKALSHEASRKMWVPRPVCGVRGAENLHFKVASQLPPSSINHQFIIRVKCRPILESKIGSSHAPLLLLRIDRLGRPHTDLCPSTCTKSKTTTETVHDVSGVDSQRNRDPEHGVTFRYPAVWKKATQFGYAGSALRGLATEPIAGFGYEEGGFPRDRIVGPYSSTNLEGVGVVYSAVEARGIDGCKRVAASLSGAAQRGTVALGGSSFLVYEVGEGSMNQYFSGNLYTTFINHTCYLFETDVAAASVASLDDISALTKAQNDFIDANLLNIMKSVRIAPSR